MRKSNTKLEEKIKERTLMLLETKEPYEIGMRDIAEVCGVSATSIYLYYKDKNDLFHKISQECLVQLEELMMNQTKAESDSVKMISVALKTFRDWCFANPRKAMLIMGKFKADEQAPKEEMDKYYVCNRMGKLLLDKCVSENQLKSENTLMDTNVLIYGLWGCVESVLQKRSDIELWSRQVEYTDRFIEIMLKGLDGE